MRSPEFLDDLINNISSIVTSCEWLVYRTVFDEGIDDIPSAGAPLDKFLCCDVCMRKEDKRKLTQIYCIICQKKFCQSHMIVSACDTPFLHSLRPKARFCWG